MDLVNIIRKYCISSINPEYLHRVQQSYNYILFDGNKYNFRFDGNYCRGIFDLRGHTGCYVPCKYFYSSYFHTM